MSVQQNLLEGRKIILGITGSISAYKSAILLRLLIKAGAEVQIIFTEAAKEFVGPLSFSTLSNKPVLSGLSADQEWAKHVDLGLWADLLVIAPASANTLAKLANGITDNLLTAVYLSAKCPIMLAPAMDLDMWKHPSTQKNIAQLQSYGNYVIPVGEGPLASGLIGPGRLAEPESIFQEIVHFFNPNQALLGKKILVTAGPTHEAIDPVRFIGNYSSGKMGIRLAEEAVRMGAQVELIIGPSKEAIFDSPNLRITRIVSAQDLLSEVEKRIQETDIFILAAAVADFQPDHIADNKIKKSKHPDLTIRLIPTPDIAGFIGSHKTEKQFLCGFALETEELEKNAAIKLKNKNMDMIVMNSPNDPGAAFYSDSNKVSILDKSGKISSFDLKSKKEVAIDILNAILENK